MKKILYILMAFSAVAFWSCKDEPTPEVPEVVGPKVDVTLSTATPTTIVAHFAKNAECVNYTTMLAEEGTMDMFMEMFGATLEECVAEWGLTFNGDTTYTWTELTPGTNYQIYYIVRGKDTTYLDSLTVRTTQNGGTGASVITIAVDDITATSAVVTCTPNSETALFKDMVITCDAYDEYGVDSVTTLLKEQSFTFYETDRWQWMSLEASTAYYVVAMGQNANGEWGAMAREQFTTLAGEKKDHELPNACRKGVAPRMISVR